MDVDPDLEAQREDSIELLNGHGKKFAKITEKAEMAHGELRRMLRKRKADNKENVAPPASRNFIDTAMVNLSDIVKISKAGSANIAAQVQEIQEFGRPSIVEAAESVTLSPSDEDMFPEYTFKEKETHFLDVSEDVNNTVMHVRERNRKFLPQSEARNAIESKIRHYYHNNSALVSHYFDQKKDNAKLKHNTALVIDCTKGVTNILLEAHKIENEQNELINRARHGIKI